MRIILLALAAAGAAFTLPSSPAQAREYPFCIQSRDTAGHGDCSYATYNDCQMAVSGRRGGCYVNPFIAYQEVVPVRRPRRAYY